MNKYAPPSAQVKDVGDGAAAWCMLRNVLALALGLQVGWFVFYEPRVLIRFIHTFLPSFLQGRYSIGVAEFFAALPFCIAVGVFAYFAFVGSRRQVWWWALSIALPILFLICFEPLLPDRSTLSYAVMSLLEFSPFLFIGATASSITFAHKHHEPAA